MKKIIPSFQTSLRTD